MLWSIPSVCYTQHRLPCPVHTPSLNVMESTLPVSSEHLLSSCSAALPSPQLLDHPRVSLKPFLFSSSIHSLADLNPNHGFIDHLYGQLPNSRFISPNASSLACKKIISNLTPVKSDSVSISAKPISPLQQMANLFSPLQKPKA